ncbi:MAG: PH domain-containing protein [Nitrosopumilus sp.]|nr:PH domain-containing protein [Nitrosopumilus sp.]
MFGRKREEEPEQELGFDISEFDKKEQSEIERVKQILEVAEIIKTVARQSKVMPGGSLVTPNIIFATDKRLIIRDPTALGLRAGMDSIPYSQINKIHLQKGAFTSEIVVDVGRFEGDNRKKIQAIPKKKASEILAIINEYIRQSQDVNSAPKTIIQKQDEDDPLKILKIRFAKGEISKEEYDEMKSALE